MRRSKFFGEQKKPHGFVANAAPVSAVRPTIQQGVGERQRGVALPCGRPHGNHVRRRCRRAIVVERQIKRHDGFTCDKG